MNWNHKLRRISALAVGLLLALSGLALAQGGGNLYGTVTDDKDQPLPGATVTLTGGNVPAVQVTDAQGDFRFLNLSPGTYKLETSLDGFSNVVLENAVIALGRNTQVQVKMSSAVTDVVTVTGETPLLDERKVSTGANLNHAELTKVPSAKDPWTVLQTVPGVLVDRINVGGNESGQQSGYVSPGATATQSQWIVDGTAITDFAAQGSSPGYYDFDAFEEMNLTTGGSDATKATPGVSINIVTRRGTNAFRFEGNYTLTSDSWQSDNEPSGGDLGPGQPSFNRGNRIDHIQKRNFQLSGPLWKDHLWLWASYGKEQINKLNPAGAGFSKDQTQLETKNGKLNAQFIDSNSLAVTFFDNDKIKLGRDIGLLAQNAWVVADKNATADQGAPPTWDKPTLQKIEDTQIFGSNFFLTGAYAKIDGSFGFTPKGGDAVIFFDQDTGLHNNTYIYQSVRPSKSYNLDGSYFFNTGATTHELKFGAAYRKSDVNSLTSLSAGGFVSSDANFCAVDCDPNRNIFIAVRDGAFNYRSKNTNAFAQDTLSWGNFTANVGLRYDKQEGFGLPGAVGANKWTSVLPAQATLAVDGASWDNITPRLGLTYAMGPEKKTLLRASYSRYADGMGPSGAYWNIVGFFGGYTYAYFYYNDPGAAGVNFDPAKIGGLIPGQSFFPPATESYTRIDKDLKAPTTDEVVLSVEHALLPEFTVAANLTYSKYNDPLLFVPIVGDGFVPGPGEGRKATQADYEPVNVTLVNGRTVTVYKLKDNIGTISTGLTELTNGNYGRTYKGLSLVGTKRLSNRWMLRGNVSFNDWKWDVKGNSFPNRTLSAGQGTAVRDGDQVIASQSGSGKSNIWISSKWAYSFTGLYQVMPDRPWGFDVGATFYGRQGYPYVETQTVSAGSAGILGLTTSYGVQTTADPDSKRLDNIRLLDVRLSKDVTFGRFGGTVAFDVFNVTNENTALARNRSLTSAQHLWISEIVSPRVFRLGLTVHVQ